MTLSSAFSSTLKETITWSSTLRPTSSVSSTSSRALDPISRSNYGYFGFSALLILVIVGCVWVKRRRGRIFPRKFPRTQRVFSNPVYGMESLTDQKQIHPKNEVNENDVWEEIELNV